MADFFDEQVDLGRRREQCGRIWVHLHPGRSAQPSGVDEETFTRCFGGADWAMMFILAKDGETFARLQFNVGPGGSVQISVETDFSLPFPAADHTSGEKEYFEAVYEEPEWCVNDGPDDLNFWNGKPVAPFVERGFSDVLDVFEESQLEHFGAEDIQ